MRELTESSASSLGSDPSDSEALINELTAPKKAAVKASFPEDPELKEIEIGGSVVPPEQTFALPGEETKASAEDVAGDDVVVTGDPVEVGGSIEPPKEDDSALDALEMAGMASLVDAAPAGEDAETDDERVARETAEEDEEEEDVFDLFEDPGVLDEPDEAASEGGDALEDALEDASDDVNRETAEEEEEDVLEDPGSPDEAELEVEAALELEDAQKVDVEPEVEVAPEVDVAPEVEVAPEVDVAPEVEVEPEVEVAPEVDFDVAPAYDEFARSIADVLDANSGEAESRAAARAAADELKKSLDDGAESSLSLTDDEADVGMHRASSGDESEERLAERVAELLRPRVGLSGLDGAGSGAPLVNINVNTNTGGVTSLGGGGDDAPSGPPPAARTSARTSSMSTELYARLMQALSAKGGGGEPDASLRDAAAHFVDELTKQVPTMGTGESAQIESAALEALPVDRVDESVTSAAKAAGLDELLYRAALAASRGDAHVSEAKDAVPRWAREPQAARDAERVGEPSGEPSSATGALDIPTERAPTDAEVEAARVRLEKAERDENAFAARLETDALDALDIPDARQEFLELQKRKVRVAREEEEGKTKRSRARAWTAPDPLDEDPEGAELAGIDGVIRTAEAMSEVWAADPKMRVGKKADAPAAVASRTDVLRANVPLKDAEKRSRRKKSTLGETKRDGDELAGDESETRTDIGSLLRELGV